MAQDDDPPSLKLKAVTPELEAIAEKDIEGCKPTGRIQQGRNKNGVYTLVGDIFGTGEQVALIDNSENIIVCKWAGGQWRAALILDAETDWKYPGWDSETAKGREPTATRPFWIIRLQKIPLLVVASYVEKAGQSYYVAMFDSKVEHILDFDTSFSCEPFVKAGYLVTMDQSRGKAEWSAVYYSRIEAKKFEIKAT